MHLIVESVGSALTSVGLWVVVNLEIVTLRRCLGSQKLPLFKLLGVSLHFRPLII